MAHEASLRTAIFAGLFVVLSVSESLWPERLRVFSRLEHWPANLVLIVLDTAMLRLLFPLLAVGVAVWAQAAGFGVFNRLPCPQWIAVATSLLALDAVLYGQHVAFHRISLLWRLHRVHHSDVDVDATTALRFHPVEIALSMGLKMMVVALLGVPPAAVVVFEMILNGAAMFNHANLQLNPGVDGWLRLFVVTPAMHRVHHSSARDETDSNFGFNLSLWDRVFGTLRTNSGGLPSPFGLAGIGRVNTNAILFAMLLPFKKGA